LGLALVKAGGVSKGKQQGFYFAAGGGRFAVYLADLLKALGLLKLIIVNTCVASNNFVAI